MCTARHGNVPTDSYPQQGYAAFARLLGDDQPELLKKLDVTQVGGVETAFAHGRLTTPSA